MKTIPLTKGYVAFVDDADFEVVSAFKWAALIGVRKVYAYRTLYIDGQRTTQYLHRFIMGVTDPAVEVDHRDHDGLNCQRQNLRESTKVSNQQHARKRQTSTTSKFKGVSFIQSKGKWRSFIQVDQKQKFLGYHDLEEAAANSYNVAAIGHFGEFADLNVTGAQ